ncbi:MAG: AMP-binding protein [Bacteroidales bacterium]|jgi:long-chain acyl-CoA synthetase|nr:AMP-binding protein [Bacteroidales bacterium]
MIKNYNKTAIVFKNSSYSYRQVLQYTRCYADFFSSKNKPEKILIYADNSPEWVFAFYGALRCEAIAIPVDIQSTQKELAYIVSDCRPDIIFTSIEKLAFVDKICDQVDDFQGKIVTSRDINTDDIDKIPVTEIPILEDDKTMVIIYTSGTTGSPKGVMQSYRNIIFVANAVSEEFPIFKRESNVMVLLPLHHSFPLMGTMIIPFYKGSTIYFAENLSSESILQTLKDGKISLIIGVPRLYDTLAKSIMAKINSRFITKLLYKMVKLIGSDQLSKLIFKSVHQKFGGCIEYLVSGGAALSDETAEIFKALGFYVLEGYGMTEASPLISFTQPGKRKIGYVGYPFKGTEFKIEPAGEICVRGANVMQGYYNRPNETAEVVKDGWLHTGDIGIYDKYGLKLTGRIKDIIVTSNGKNINPEEIEADILSATRYIKEVAVFMNSSTLQAVVVPELKEIRQHAISDLNELIKEDIALFNQESSSYKRIKRFHIISDEIPRTRLGKIQRFKIPTLISKQEIKKSNATEESQSKVYRQLKTFIEEETGYVAAPDDHFEIDLSMDSLSRVSLLSYIENSFDLLLNEEHLESLNTLNKLTRHIEEHSTEISNNKASWAEILHAKIPQISIPTSGFIHNSINILSKIVFHLSYRYSVNGIENIPADEPCIIVANHRSSLDGLIITARMKRKMMQNTFFFAKEKHWRTKFARFMAGQNNVIIMDINKNVKESLQQMSYVLRQGKNVIIFPEGTRSKNNELKQFKESFAILSKELGVPVLPVAINGSEKATVTPLKLPRLFAKIQVNFLNPVYPHTEQNIKKLRDQVMDIIAKALELG